MTREELEAIEERHAERENGAGLSFGRTAKGRPWVEPGTSGLVEAHEDRGALLAEVRRLREENERLATRPIDLRALSDAEYLAALAEAGRCYHCGSESGPFGCCCMRDE